MLYSRLRKESERYAPVLTRDGAVTVSVGELEQLEQIHGEGLVTEGGQSQQHPQRRDASLGYLRRLERERQHAVVELGARV